jgi:hypothetical protein
MLITIGSATLEGTGFHRLILGWNFEIEIINPKSKIRNPKSKIQNRGCYAASEA